MNEPGPAILPGVVAIALCVCAPCAAQTWHVDAQATDRVGWTIQLPSEGAATRVIQHRRETADLNPADKVEVFRFRTEGRNQRGALSCVLPPARPFDELNLQVRLRSTQEGLQVAARVVFVDHPNPRTGRPLTAYVRGEIYRREGEWQLLSCLVDDRAVSRALRELRARTALELPAPGHTYVDRATILCDFNPGDAEVAIDGLKFGPVISPGRVATDTPVAQPKQHHTAPRPVDLRLGQLRVDSRPFFPRIAPWHGESMDQLKQAGINTVLIPDINDVELLARMKQAGLWAIAVPPRPEQLGPDYRWPVGSERVLFWYLGTAIPAYQQERLVAWSRALQKADPVQRPIMADVIGAERTYSRYVDLLGLSRPLLGTSLSLRDYRDTLVQRRSLAQPGKFTWTRVQTEASTAHRRLGSGSNYVVEPEQIRLQTYAALASGSRAIAFWKTSQLGQTAPGAAEQQLMMHQLGLEIGLIEDWLSTGRLIGTVDCEAGATIRGRRGGTNAEIAWRGERDRRRMLNPLSGRTGSEARTTNVQAAVFNTSNGRLLMPVWYSSTAQLVPGELVASNLSLVVHVYQDQREAWLVTTTSVRKLPAVPQEGGLRIHLSTTDRQTFLDQTAIIVITSKETVIPELKRRIATIAEDSARTALHLARAKRNRVSEVEAMLSLNDDRTRIAMGQADRAIERAEQSINQGDFDSGRRQAQQAARYLRRLQHARWKLATRDLTTSVASPYAVSYQTLPDHQRLLKRLRDTRPSRTQSLLPDPSETDTEQLKNTGWSRFPSQSSTTRGEARLVKERGNYILTLTAAPRNSKEPPEIVSTPPIRVTSPVLQLRQGELVQITGRIRVPARVVGCVDGAMIFDSTLGPAGAIRWKNRTGGWKEFELIREVTGESPFYLSIVLSGLGQVQVADLQATVFASKDGVPARLTSHGQELPTAPDQEKTVR